MMKRLVFTLFLILPAAALAAAITQGFYTKTALPAGTIVSLNKNPGVVTATTRDNIDSMVGVVASNDAAVFSTAESSDQAQVATGGTVNTFVSNADGDIKVGDRITVNELSGVGVKVKNNARVLGIAQGSLDARSPGAVKQTLTDTKGGKHDVYISQVPVLIGITNYSAAAGRAGKSSFLPDAVESFAAIVAGKVVSPYSVLVAIIALVLAFTIAGIMLNGAIRGGIISIGRNPLARQAVYKGLFGVIAFAAGIILAGLGLAVAVLKYL